MESIFLLLAYLALGRVASLEQLRYHSTGEWGKLLSLDRMPEVKTLRKKIAVLGDDEGCTARWSEDLAKDWLAHDVKAVGVLLIDGHVRVYQGQVGDAIKLLLAAAAWNLSLWMRQVLFALVSAIQNWT